MPKLADMRARLDAASKDEWYKYAVAWGGGETFYKVTPHASDAEDLSEQDADFAVHAPADMRALLDGLGSVLDGKPIRYVVSQLDLIAKDLEAQGDHGMAQMLARLAVMLERLG